MVSEDCDYHGCYRNHICVLFVSMCVGTGLIAQDIRGNEEWVIRAARVRASRENPDALRAIK